MIVLGNWKLDQKHLKLRSIRKTRLTKVSEQASSNVRNEAKSVASDMQSDKVCKVLLCTQGTTLVDLS